MLIVETIGRIRRAHLWSGKSIRQIARDLKISRNTVRRILRSGETWFSYEREIQPRPKLGRWKADIDRMPTSNSQAGSGGGRPMCRWAGNGRSPADGVRRGLLRRGCKGSRCRDRRPLLFCIFPATRRFRVGSEGAASALSVRPRSVPPNPPPRRARAAWLRPTIRRRGIA